MLRLGLMGGTFDPLHWAHLVIAEEAAMRFRLDKVLFMTSGEPPHKAGYRISEAEHRYAMVVLGTASNPLFEASRLELDREGPSYSVDTIRTLRNIYGPDVEVFFIIGADEAFDIPNWHEAESLPEIVRFIAAPRPGFDPSELESRLAAHFCEIIEFLPITTVDISATDIRNRVASGRSIRYLVPDSIEAYVRKHGLYLEGSAP